MPRSADTCNPRVRKGTLSEADLEIYVGMFKALGHPVRLRMVDLIREAGGELCVCEFEAHFDLKQPTISHHLKVLRNAGIIRSRQDATWVRHSIAPAASDRLREIADMIVGLQRPIPEADAAGHQQLSVV